MFSNYHSTTVLLSSNLRGIIIFSSGKLFSTIGWGAQTWKWKLSVMAFLVCECLSMITWLSAYADIKITYTWLANRCLLWLINNIIHNHFSWLDYPAADAAAGLGANFSVILKSVSLSGSAYFPVSSLLAGKCVLAGMGATETATFWHTHSNKYTQHWPFAVVSKVSLAQLKIVSVRLMPRTWCELYCHLCGALASWALPVVLPPYPTHSLAPVHHYQNLLPNGLSTAAAAFAFRLVIFYFNGLFTEFKLQPDNMERTFLLFFWKTIWRVKKLCTDELSMFGLSLLPFFFAQHTSPRIVALVRTLEVCTKFTPASLCWRKIRCSA